MGRRNPVAVPVEPGNLSLWKGQLDWHFKSFCRSGDWTPEELWSDCERGARQLWVIWQDQVIGAVLTEIMGSKLVVTHGAGKDRAMWMPLWVVLEAFARANGLDGIKAICRHGWEREMRGVGMRKTHVIMEKRL